ncbi:MAG: restriction endonuclease subunit S [Nitrososphaerota archaeon]|nr:restriction endonuclease subunit S [Nitrososphaerota archaeon]
MKAIDEASFKQTELGTIPRDWEVRKLQSLCAREVGILTGPFGSQLHNRDYVNQGTPIITVEHLGENRILHENLPKISNEDRLRLRKYSLMEGDIVFSRVGSVDRRSIVRKEEDGWLFSGRCLRVRSNRNFVDPSFLSYYFGLERFKERIRGRAVGATMPSINTRLLAEIEIIVPPLTEQLAISEILSSLDSKIELNHQMNKTLEALGQAIFRHWFIDFEFPNEEGKPYKSSGGEMVYNEELRKMMPKGWEVEKFSDLIEVNPKRELSKGNLAKKVSMADLNPWQSWIESWNVEEFHSGQKFKNGDTLFARITPSLEHGKTALVSLLDPEEIGFGSTEFIVLSTGVIRSPLYIFHLSRSDEIRSVAISAMTGTSGRQRVPDSVFDFISVVLPPFALIDLYEQTVMPLFNKITGNAREKKDLSQIRDLLLPKLMSGKIRVEAKG